MTYEVVTPAPRERWQEVLNGSGSAMAFQTPEWTDAVCASRGWRDASRSYTAPDGRRLVLPMVSRRPPLTERASLPYGWGFGGIIGDGPVTAADLAAVVADVAALRGARIAVRPDPFAPPWPAQLPTGGRTVARRAHVLDLDGGFAEVWGGRFTGSARTAVRKAERAGLEVEADSAGRLLPDFYRLYERSIARWNPTGRGGWLARRRDPMSKFAAVVRHTRGSTRIWVARRSGEPVAAIVTLHRGNVVNYWRGAMDEELAGPSRANYLLHKLAIEAACTEGCTTYHMGETGSSSSLAQFKTRFGARPVDYAELRIEAFPLTPVVEQAGRAAERIRRALPSGTRRERRADG